MRVHEGSFKNKIPIRITPFEAKDLVLLVITNAKNHGNLNDMQNM